MAKKPDPRFQNVTVEYVATKEEHERAMRAIGRYFAEKLWNELHGEGKKEGKS